MDPVTRLPVPTPPLEPEDELELLASMARHPAGKGRRLTQCPTCGNSVSGALGDPGYVLAQ